MKEIKFHKGNDKVCSVSLEKFISELRKYTTVFEHSTAAMRL